MKKFVKDLTLKEYKRYSNLRAADGNWSQGMAMTACTFLADLPKRKFLENKVKYDNRCEQYFQEIFDFSNCVVFLYMLIL